MDRGKMLLISLGMGFVVMAVADIKVPATISLGLATFVTLLTLHDFSEDMIRNWHQKEGITREEYFKKTNLIDKAMMILSSSYMLIAFPLSFSIPYFASNNQTVDEMLQSSQNLTFYSLGLVIFIISRDRNNLKRENTSANS